MKKALLPLLCILSVFVSCSDSSDKPDNPTAKLTCRGASIEENVTVNPDMVSDITVSFNNVIQILAADAITLNGKKADAKASGMELNIAVSLDHATDYKLCVGAGAVALASDKNITNDAFTLTFKTEKGFDASSVAAKPVNSKATAETVALYEMLRESYGKVMYSGAMGGVGWETTYTDFIEKNTGAYPAVVGFDYLHLSSSPANWIDYGDITPVKSVHKRGCIVEIGWHWNVPTAEGASDMTFSTRTSFNPANVLIDGTWENKVAVADVDKLAGYLDLLQDAKIPVLWRPLHEAAGDYKWGAWFWWGSQGTDVTKKLWYWLYDKLTNQYGLNNLIWVWTACTSEEGKMADIAKIKAAYPGDDFVDIIGTDLYPSGELTDQTPQFNLVNAVADSHKIVALTECGNLVDPDKAAASNALWCYFMQWYDMDGNGQYGFSNYKGPEQWKTVLANPRVVNK